MIINKTYICLIGFIFIIAISCNSICPLYGCYVYSLRGELLKQTYYNYSTFNENGNSIHVNEDESLLVSGTARFSVPAIDFGIAKLDKNLNFVSSFGTNGKASFDFGGSDIGRKVLVQNNGIYFSGTANVSYLGAVKTDLNGNLDTTYGVAGLFSSGTFLSGGAFSSLILPDNSLILAGSHRPANVDLCVKKVNPSGVLDTTFGTAGTFTLDFAASTDTLNNIVFSEDGNFLVTGYVGAATTDAFFGKLKQDGSGFDTAFGGGGVGYITYDSGGIDYYTSMAVLSNNKILVAGYTQPSTIHLAKFSQDGLLDTTFGTAGRSIVAGLGTATVINDMVLERNGKIVLAGYSTIGGQNHALIARFNYNGSLDTSFKDQGFYAHKINSGSLGDIISKIAWEKYGTLIAVGTHSEGSLSSTFVARYR